MTRDDLHRLAEVLQDAADMYDDHVFEKMRLRFEPGNNLVFEWDDVTEDDVKEIGARP